MDPDPASYSRLLLLLQHQPGLALDHVVLAAQVVCLLLLLLASAIFSGSEVALLSLDRSARQRLSRAGDRASARVLLLLEQPRRVAVTLLLLSILVNLGVAVLSTLIVTDIGGTFGWSPSQTAVTTVIVLIALGVLIFGVARRLIAPERAPGFSRSVSALLLALHQLILPVSGRLAGTVSRVQNRLKRSATTDTTLSEGVDGNHEGNGVREPSDEESNELAESLAEFSETTVREIMVSRMDILALPASATLAEALDLIRQSGHSRLPLYVDHLDEILGIVYAKDLLAHLAQRSDPALADRVDWTRIARPPMFVPSRKRLDDLLKDFQVEKMHIAIVVDEYGGTAGLVTLEDVLEEIVGDIQDEHDTREEALYDRLEDGAYRIDARIDLDELNEILGTDVDSERFDFETLGGLIFHLTGSIPAPGEEIDYPPLRMRVESVEAHRIGHVVVHVVDKTEADDVSDVHTGDGR